MVGISPQGVSSHQRFRDTFSLPFPLLADPRKKVIRAFGVDGPLGFGVRRVTFKVDQDGVITDRIVADLAIGQHTTFIDSVIEES